MRHLIFSSVLIFSYVGCASETFTLKVSDYDGFAVADAVITVKSINKVMLFGSDKAKDFNTYSASTDSNGIGVVRFSCPNGQFTWWVTADSCYPSMSFTESFMKEEACSFPASVKVVLQEHERHRNLCLHRKKNPQPMFAYTDEKRVNAPHWNGRFGFDLQYFDWLPPLGQGKIADFYYVRNMTRGNIAKEESDRKKIQQLFSFKQGSKTYPKDGDIVGRIEFAPHCGAYIEKKTENDNFPSTYQADEAASYSDSFQIRIEAQKGNKWLHQAAVVKRDEYMVIRSRVVCNDSGKIVSANYAKILGPLDFSTRVAVGEAVFNPRSNDTNLEFDPERNLYQGKNGRGMIP